MIVFPFMLWLLFVKYLFLNYYTRWVMVVFFWLHLWNKQNEIRFLRIYEDHDLYLWIIELFKIVILRPNSVILCICLIYRAKINVNESLFSWFFLLYILYSGMQILLTSYIPDWNKAFSQCVKIKDCVRQQNGLCQCYMIVLIVLWLLITLVAKAITTHQL